MLRHFSEIKTDSCDIILYAARDGHVVARPAESNAKGHLRRRVAELGSIPQHFSTLISPITLSSSSESRPLSRPLRNYLNSVVTFRWVPLTMTKDGSRRVFVQGSPTYLLGGDRLYLSLQVPSAGFESESSPSPYPVGSVSSRPP
jgi:hypothetical protein